MSTLQATVSVDLDNLWAYQRTSANPGWKHLASYLQIAVPRMLDALDEAGITATIFIVGADAVRPWAHEVLGPITTRGHEVGNHSYGHACWLHRWHAPELHEELERADGAIRAATGQAPIGFRGPGFVWSTPLLTAVADRGYLFDASTLPTSLAPLMRRRLLQHGQLTIVEKQERQDLFGPRGSNRLPSRPYRWRLPDGRQLLEIPVSTVPLLGLPFHQSYICYIASFSRPLARAYLHAALLSCRAAGVAPSMLLHPLDWLGGEEVPELRYFPGMQLSAAMKLDLLKDTLRILGGQFRFETMGAQARRLAQDGGLREQMAPPAMVTRWSAPIHMEREPVPFRKTGDLP